MTGYNDYSIEKLNELAYQNDPEAQRRLVVKAICGDPGVSKAQSEYWLKQLENNENPIWQGIGHYLHGQCLVDDDISKAASEFHAASELNILPASFAYVYYEPILYCDKLHVYKPEDDYVMERMREYWGLNSDYEVRRKIADNYLYEILKVATALAARDEIEPISNIAEIEKMYLYTFLGCYYYSSHILLNNGYLETARTIYDDEFDTICKNDIIKAEKYLQKAISLGNAYMAYSILGAIYIRIYEYEVKYVDEQSTRNFTGYKDKGLEYLIKAVEGSPEKIVIACAYARVIKSYLEGEYSSDNIVEIIRKYFRREEYIELTEVYNDVLQHWNLYFELSLDDLQKLKSRVPDDVRAMIDAYIHRSKVWVCWNCGAENEAVKAVCVKCNSRLSGRWVPLKSLSQDTNPEKSGSGKHSHKMKKNAPDNDSNISKSSSGGCYIATCVYGSYDCPEVWVLRRYRDYHMKNTILGRWFIRMYYRYSPKVVAKYGDCQWFHNCVRPILNRIVRKLSSSGIKNTPYTDQ